MCRLVQDYQQPNVHEHNQGAIKGAVERVRLLLLGGFCGFRLLRAAELRGGSQQDDRVLMQRVCRGKTIETGLGAEERANAPSSHGSYALCEAFVTVCLPWAQAQTTRMRTMLAIIILHKLGAPSGYRRTLTSRYLGSNFLCAASSS